jgi:hypothetical protein
MAIYKIFSEKDSFIWSEQLTQNMGRDEILEISTYNNPDIVNNNISLLPSVTRALVKFPQSQIDSLLGNVINIANTSSTWDVFFNLYLANASNLPQTYTLQCNAISQSWEMGTGRLADYPLTHNGVSWTYRFSSSSTVAWQTSSFQANVTASDNGKSGQRGGGNWFIIPSSSQTFNYRQTKDTNFNVSNIIRAWYTGAIPNNTFDGFIIKQDPEFVDSKDYQPELKYYSVDTNTIYPPQLQFSWIDYTFNTGSSTQTILNVLPANITIEENPGIFYNESINRFRVNARPEFPIQLWQTSSVYTNNYYLPTASYYAVKDLYTNEFIIDFDPLYTQLSADSVSSYFDVYMNGLEPERYYTILIKTTINGSTIVFNNQYSFKVNNG